MVPKETTAAIVEHELGGARAWAERVGARLEWKADALHLHAIIPRAGADDCFYIVGQFENYREVPPAWSFAESDWRVTGAPSAAPKPRQTPFGSCIFIQHGTPPRPVIAPFNRLAYAEERGPHSDWGGPAQWLNYRSGVFAPTIGDMLAAMRRDIVATEGRMG